MSKDITLLQPHHLRMVEVQVGPANGCPGDLDDHILILGDIGDWRIDHPHILVAEPSECSHGGPICTVLILGLGGG